MQASLLKQNPLKCIIKYFEGFYHRQKFQFKTFLNYFLFSTNFMDNSNLKVVKLGMSFKRKTKMHKSFADDWRFGKKLLNYSTIYEHFMVKTIFLVRILIFPTFHQNFLSQSQSWWLHEMIWLQNGLQSFSPIEMI